MISDRLKNERERLRLTQPEFAEASGVSKRTVIEWEKGNTSPNAVQLSSLSGVGVDVQYVLTGEKSTFKKLMDKFEEEDDGDESRDEELFTMNTPATYRLNKDEWELIQRFRCADLKTKMEVMQLLLSVDMADKTTDDYKPESNENRGSGITVSGSGNRVAGRNYNERKK
ncbi:helix-turn-helix transcriptional regulator [Budviciaceae bacterium BWR-B9]|uniref:Helix-turn-helix transcriptional regulator n=2 Tax=Budviciaceae TaxID=1903416 RepID=A0ABS1IMM2_9GAMM|nr:helix-turn-helix transcriptional regulator [Limnobaculum allomyrinae]MBV7693320.1 helix-turn-helix domain-containing protein [Limnobaculum sp. M2-1]